MSIKKIYIMYMIHFCTVSLASFNPFISNNSNASNNRNLFNSSPLQEEQNTTDSLKNVNNFGDFTVSQANTHESSQESVGYKKIPKYEQEIQHATNQAGQIPAFISIMQSQLEKRKASLHTLRAQLLLALKSVDNDLQEIDDHIDIPKNIESCTENLISTLQKAHVIHTLQQHRTLMPQFQNHTPHEKSGPICSNKESSISEAMIHELESIRRKPKHITAITNSSKYVCDDTSTLNPDEVLTAPYRGSGKHSQVPHSHSPHSEKHKNRLPQTLNSDDDDDDSD